MDSEAGADAVPRTAGRRRRTASRVALAAAALAAAALLVAPQALSERTLFDRPSEKLLRAETILRESVLRRNDIAALWTFDGPDPSAWMPSPAVASWRELAEHRRFAAAPGTDVVPGRYGGARRFPGDADCWLRQEREWPMRPAGFSVTLWANLRPLPVRQDLFASADDGQWGLRLDGGRLLFDAIVSGGIATASCPFDSFGRWTHLAAVSDPEAGELRLYADGRLAGSAPATNVLPRLWSLAFGSASRFKTRHPLHGDVDDACAWNRVLSADEIRAIAGSPVPLLEMLATPRERKRVSRARRSRDLLAALGRLKVLPVRRSDLRPERPCERVSLVLGGAERRRLVRRHARSRRSGGLGPDAARPVRGFLTVGGRTTECLVSLFGFPACYPDAERLSFSVVPAEPGSAFPDGRRRLVLAPPESAGWAVPLAESLVAEETGLPLAPRCSVVSLRLNGRDAGAYLCRDFSLAGATPAGMEIPGGVPPVRLGADVTREERRFLQPEGLSARVRDAVLSFFDADRGEALARRLAGSFAPVLSDGRSPVRPSIRRAALAAAESELRSLASAPPQPERALPREGWLAGTNASPDRVVADLDFGTWRGNLAKGLSIEFRSRSPETIGSDGRLARRPGDVPEFVEVEATVRDAKGRSRTRTLSFRVMPESYPVPAVFAWCPVRLDKLRREDGAIQIFAPGEVRNEPDRTLPATAAGRGGLRWRGNRGFRRSPKKIFGWKTDFPHGLFGEGPARSAAAMNAMSDLLFLGNPFAFDLFRRMPPREDGGTNLSPRVVVAEAFLNGRYHGLTEFAERIGPDLPGIEPGDVVFRHARVSPRVPDMAAAIPRPREGDFDAPIRRAEELFARPPGSPGWERDVEETFDLGNLADFELLTNLFGNLNGYGSDVLVDETPVFRPSDGRFRFVPWDFDGTLDGRSAWMELSLDRILFERSPAHRARLAARWDRLRAGPWSDAALEGEIRSRTEKLLPAIVSDYAKWERISTEEARDLVPRRLDGKLSALRKRIATIDAKLASAREEEDRR